MAGHASPWEGRASPKAFATKTSLGEHPGDPQGEEPRPMLGTPPYTGSQAGAHGRAQLGKASETGKTQNHRRERDPPGSCRGDFFLSES